MATSYFTIPDTGTIVYEGDIVILSEYYNNFAIASHGWYEYNQTRTNGWYFLLIPTNKIIPAANVNLSLLTVVTSASCPPPRPTPIPDPDAHTQKRTFIVFDTIAERDGLTPEFIPNGRIVRVNDAGPGKAEYYEWDAENGIWNIWDISRYITEMSEQLAIVKADIEMRQENDKLENALAGLPERSKEELNAMLESRLSGF